MVLLHDVCASGSLETLKSLTKSQDPRDFVFTSLFEPRTLDTPLHKCAEHLEMAAYLIDVLRHPVGVLNAAGLTPAFAAATRVGLSKVKDFYTSRGASFDNIDALFVHGPFEEEDVAWLLSNKKAYVSQLEPVVRATWMFPKNLFFLESYKGRARLDPTAVKTLMNETMVSKSQIVRLVDKWCVPTRLLDVFLGDSQLEYVLLACKWHDLSYRAFVRNKPLPVLLAETIVTSHNKIAAQLLIRLCEQSQGKAMYHMPFGFESAQQILNSARRHPLIQTLLETLSC